MGISSQAYVCYEWERTTYPEYRNVKLDRDGQKLYIGKLARHFKVAKPELGQSHRRGGAGVYQRRWWYGLICCGKESDLGTICHEFAHHLVYERHGKQKKHHGRKFKRELKRVYTWAKRWLPTAASFNNLTERKEREE